MSDKSRHRPQQTLTLSSVNTVRDSKSCKLSCSVTEEKVTELTVVPGDGLHRKVVPVSVDI